MQDEILITSISHIFNYSNVSHASTQWQLYIIERVFRLHYSQEHFNLTKFLLAKEKEKRKYIYIYIYTHTHITNQSCLCLKKKKLNTIMQRSGPKSPRLLGTDHHNCMDQEIPAHSRAVGSLSKWSRPILAHLTESRQVWLNIQTAYPMICSEKEIMHWGNLPAEQQLALDVSSQKVISAVGVAKSTQTHLSTQTHPLK